MRFTKIKCQTEKVHLEWTTPAENAEAQLVEHRLASDEGPHPDFLAAMQAFRHEVGRLLELPELWSKELDVIGLSINYEDDGRLGLVITCLRPLSTTNAPLFINTPHLREADAEEEGNFLPTSIRCGAGVRGFDPGGPFRHRERRWWQAGHDQPMSQPSTALRPELPPLPERMRRLPVDHRGYPVPFFVAYVDGVPDHRIMDAAKLARALKEHLCWVCGERLGTYLAFVIGPMCAVNRISGEPPAHRECAEWSAKGCPFMSRPHAHRREAGKPEDAEASDNAIQRNPGVTLIWITKSYQTVRDSGSTSGKPLFRMGEPLDVICYAEGRLATLDEIRASVDSGLPLLEESARAEGAAAQVALRDQVGIARRLLRLAAA